MLRVAPSVWGACQVFVRTVALLPFRLRSWNSCLAWKKKVNYIPQINRKMFEKPGLSSPLRLTLSFKATNWRYGGEGCGGLHSIVEHILVPRWWKRLSGTIPTRTARPTFSTLETKVAANPWWNRSLVFQDFRKLDLCGRFKKRSRSDANTMRMMAQLCEPII